jgi:hypothetical protein
MDIKKFSEYIKEENIYDTPEEYIAQALKDIENRIREMIPEDGAEEEPEDEIISFTKARKQGDEKEKAKSELKFRDYGTRIKDVDLSRANSTLTVRIEEEESWYTIIVMIELAQGIPTDKTKDFSHKDIKNCTVKMKKYGQDDQIHGHATKTIEIKDFDEDFLIDLKLEADGEQKEGIGIETE